ncbi:MAG: glycoside hydrolase family 11 protein [Anaeromyxobacter sp.]
MSKIGAADDTPLVIRRSTSGHKGARYSMRILALTVPMTLLIALACDSGDSSTSLEPGTTGTGGVTLSTGNNTGGAGTVVATGGRATGGAGTGIVATGGRATGGAGTGVAQGGTPSTGGASATGGSVSTCAEADLQACASGNSNKVGKHCGLTYEIWTDASNSCMTNTAKGFRASWTTANGNYLARKGVRPGSTSPIVTYSADYKPNGNSYLAIYGWTQNPLIEYYIVDSWGDWRPPGTNSLGTVTVDGGTYDIYQSLRDNKPSIEGNKTFYQYWSVRKEKRTSGTITVGPHFEAWKKFGLTMGTFYEVSLVIEGYQSSGSADVTVSFK